MQIIFGARDLEKLKEKYTVLELDTIRVPLQGDITAYAVVEVMNLNDIPQLEQWVNLHKKLIECYRKKQWKFCEDAIDHLKFRWNGELNSFYTELSQRIAKYKEQDPGPEWDGVYDKVSSSHD